jgi:hypothetical protein
MIASAASCIIYKDAIIHHPLLALPHHPDHHHHPHQLGPLPPLPVGISVTTACVHIAAITQDRQRHAYTTH